MPFPNESFRGSNDFAWILVIFIYLYLVYMDSERPIKAGQTRNTRPNMILPKSKFQVCSTGASLKLLRNPQLIPNRCLPNEEPLSCCVGKYFPEALGKAVCVPVVRKAVAISGLRTGSEEGAGTGADTEDLAILGEREDAKRYENGFGNMANGAV